MKIISSLLFTGFIYLSNVSGQLALHQQLDQFTGSEVLQNASVSFEVIDLSTGKTIASHDPNRALPTASTAKLFSTATALELLGEHYTPVTRLYYDGTISEEGVLRGDLYIRGGGDPSLGSRYFFDAETRDDFLDTWVHEISATGIKRIEGAIIADASEFGYEGVPDGWNWVDIGNYYGAGPSGLCVYDNLIEFTFKTPVTPGALTTVVSQFPEIQGLTFHNEVKSSTSSGDNSYIYGAPYSNHRFAVGTLPKGRDQFVVKGSLPDAEKLLGEQFMKALTDSNIDVTGQVKTGRLLSLKSNDDAYGSRTLIYTHAGARLGEVIDLTNEKSINLFAEHLISLMGYVKAGNGATALGLQVMENHWKTRFNTTGLHINDGSGLSRTNAVSARHYVQLLHAVYEGDVSKRFIASLPVAGVSGTLKNVCRNQAGHGRVIAKSGTMNRIKSYAGYVHGHSGKMYAFALIVNNYNCSSRVLVNKMELIFNEIAKL